MSHRNATNHNPTNLTVLGLVFSLNFVKSHFITPFNQFEFRSCQQINELQNLNQASDRYHIDTRLRLHVSKKFKQSKKSKFPLRCSNKWYMPNTRKFPCILFLKTHYLGKIRFFRHARETGD